MNPSKTGIKRGGGGGGEERRGEERGHSADPARHSVTLTAGMWELGHGRQQLQLGRARGSCLQPLKAGVASSCAGPSAHSPQQPWGPPDTPGPAEPTGWTQHQERRTGQRPLNAWERGQCPLSHGQRWPRREQQTRGRAWFWKHRLPLWRAAPSPRLCSAPPAEPGSTSSAQLGLPITSPSFPMAPPARSLL